MYLLHYTRDCFFAFFIHVFASLHHCLIALTFSELGLQALLGLGLPGTQYFACKNQNLQNLASLQGANQSYQDDGKHESLLSVLFLVRYGLSKCTLTVLEILCK